MITKLSLLLNRISTPRNLGISFLIFAIFPIVLLPTMQARLHNYSGGVGPIDLLFSYSPDEVYIIVAAFGEKGRQAYALGAAIVDGAFPLAYALFQAILLTITFRRVFAKDSLMQRLHLFPFGAMIFDYLENSGIIFMLLRFPDEMRGVARLTSVFTSTKWILVGISGVLVLIGLLGVGYKKLVKGSS